jgi:hypothetical protein
MPVQTWIFMSHYNIENDKAVFKNVSVNANVMSISMFKLQIYNSDILIPNEKWHQCKQGYTGGDLYFSFYLQCYDFVRNSII